MCSVGYSTIWWCISCKVVLLDLTETMRPGTSMFGLLGLLFLITQLSEVQRKMVGRKQYQLTWYFQVIHLQSPAKQECCLVETHVCTWMIHRLVSTILCIHCVSGGHIVSTVFQKSYGGANNSRYRCWYA